MVIKEVLCTDDKRIMSIEEVANHKEHSKIKKSLNCATQGCEAKISFVSGTAGRHDHFRTVMHSEHSSECYIHRDKEKLKERIKYRETIEGSLDDQGTKQRVMYFFDKLKNPNKSKNPTPNRAKETTSATEDTSGVNVILGGAGSPSIDEIKESKKNVSFRVPTRQLNQISASEEGKYIQLYALIDKVTKTGKGFELDLSLDNAKAKLVLNESFLKGSKDVQLEEYLKSLSAFVDSKKHNYQVSVYTFCMFDTFKGNETIIYASDFKQLFISVSGKNEKPRKLDSFQALFVTGIWSI